MGIVGVLVALAVAVGSGNAATVDAHTADLSFSDRGAAVAELNDALAAAGFQPDAGSRFGSKTRHAVYAFQNTMAWRRAARSRLSCGDLSKNRYNWRGARSRTGSRSILPNKCFMSSRRAGW